MRAVPTIRNISYCLLLLSFIGLAGCSWFKKTSVDRHVTTLPIARQASLDTRHLFPLAMQGDYLQKIKTTVKQKQYTLSVYLTLEPNRLQATAFNDIAGRLYQLTWQPSRIHWTGSRYVPKALKPEHIVGDFLLANLPLAQLKNALHGARVYEKTMGQNKVRTIISQLAVLRTIHYSKPLGPLWQHTVINNPQLDYTLDIQTVAAP